MSISNLIKAVGFQIFFKDIRIGRKCQNMLYVIRADKSRSIKRTISNVKYWMLLKKASFNRVFDKASKGRIGIKGPGSNLQKLFVISRENVNGSYCRLAHIENAKQLKSLTQLICLGFLHSTIFINILIPEFSDRPKVTTIVADN